MDIFSLINNIATTLLVISPTVFILGVTLLGNAIETSKQEEKAAREGESTMIKKEIQDVETSLVKAKKDGDTTKVYSSLENLKKRQKDTDQKIKEIKIKYNGINLLNTVIYPCVSLFLVLILNQYALFLNEEKFNLSLYLLISLLCILIFYALFKIYKSLSLIEKINANKKDDDQFDRITQCIKIALIQHDQSKKEDTFLEFVDKSFPLNVVCSSELKIDFFVGLKKGSFLNDVRVWFYIPDGFDLVRPTESESWRQPANFSPPNIRTVKVILGKVNIGPRHPGSITIKTPTIPGTYTIKYSIQGDGYDGAIQDIRLIVG